MNGKEIEKLYHENRLTDIDHVIKCVNEKWFNDLKDTDKVYVYLKSFPKDEILTGKYYQNCGQIYGDQRDEWLSKIDRKDWKIEKIDGSEVWEVCIMTLKELKDLLLREKGMQIILEEKYPGIIF